MVGLRAAFMAKRGKYVVLLASRRGGAIAFPTHRVIAAASTRIKRTCTHLVVSCVLSGLLESLVQSGLSALYSGRKKWLGLL